MIVLLTTSDLRNCVGWSFNVKKNYSENENYIAILQSEPLFMKLLNIIQNIKYTFFRNDDI